MILVTGGSGFIGSHLLKSMTGSDIINLDVKKPNSSYSSRHTHVTGDIRNKDLVFELAANCDTIIHLAAIWDDFIVDKTQYYSVNIDGTRNLIEAAKQFGIRKFINFSSVSVYGDNSGECLETSPCEPVNDYGKSKYAAEKLFSDWCKEDETVGIVHLRPSVVFGANNFGNIYRLISQIHSGYYFNINKPGIVKSISYVENLVAATIYLLNNIRPGIEVYNYSDKPHFSTIELSNIISKAFHKKPAIKIPFWAVYAMALPFDLVIALTKKNLPISTARVRKICTPTLNSCDKLLAAGFKPAFTSSEGIQKTVNWYLQNFSKE